MSQGQPQRSPEPVKYGDVFNVSGQLASQPITPQDAATLQAAETAVYGKTIKGGPAAVLQSAADFNERCGVVGHDDMTGAVRDRGATVAEADVGGYRIVTEAVGGQVLGQYGVPLEMETDHSKSTVASGDDDAVTIGEALEATALSAGNKPVDKSDVAAIQAAEVRATGLGHVVAGGVGAEAQSAAAHNMQTTRDEEKTTLADVLTDASDKLIGDKAVTSSDAERVIYAELRNKDDPSTNPGGVAAVVAAAARLNQK
ncbi:late embryogenesis abundant protein D-34-like [Salvia miltiorrhiza]|uniref:late embryogenesis abundant protein D-34-like n=1 Tax=Salvia miltiorrhiza TaxID=226208 RepID=UPI0025AC625D|nr:late embryogenesis abundant protein D-34-like [Salvia miltiorrhiza]